MVEWMILFFLAWKAFSWLRAWDASWRLVFIIRLRKVFCLFRIVDWWWAAEFLWSRRDAKAIWERLKDLSLIRI
jgi:hypothetical protein